jgi:hypothetical protein
VRQVLNRIGDDAHAILAPHAADLDDECVHESGV